VRDQHAASVVTQPKKNESLGDLGRSSPLCLPHHWPLPARRL
jgi:hypothetical protein